MVNVAMDSLKQLETDTELDEQEWLQALSALLRRIVINLHGRKATAGLVGTQWLEYLDRHAKHKGFAGGVGQLLTTQPYQEAPNYDRKELAELVRNWVKTQTRPVKQTSGAKHAWVAMALGVMVVAFTYLGMVVV